ncbi:MAG: hypothetical protein ABEH35_04540 [Haloarculaceae archaeon]
MEFDQVTTAVAFVVLFAILAVGTFMSPMSTSTVGMVLGGLLVFGLVVLALGVKHGEYRASR